jgi:branched-chain amino acid transport system substrate-binding protein
MMMRKTQFLMVAAATFGMTSGLSAYADTVVKIGHIAPLTGNLAHQGKDLENGARLAVDEINQSGLVIAGQKITLVLDSQDDAGDPRQGTQAAQRLIDDGVVAVVGHLNSGVNIPASKLYNDAGITNITPAASNPFLTLQGFKTEYRLVATDAQQGPALAKYAEATFKPKTVGVVDDATAYGQGLANEFAKSAATMGIKVLPREVTNDKAIDFRAILTKLKSERPDVIMFGGMDATGGPFAKQAKQLAMDSKVLLGDGGCTANLPELAGAAAGSVYCSEGGMAITKMPGGVQFQKKYEERFKVPVQTYAPFSYDAVYVIVDAMKRAQSVSAAKVLDVMPTTDYSGVTGKIEFAQNGDLKHPVVSIYRYQDGQKTLVDVMKP